MGNLNLNMKAIGSAAGLSAGLSGSSLLAINDVAFARSVPNMVVLCPADTMEAVKMMEAMAKTESPCYMRFCGAVNLPMVYSDDYNFEIGKAVELVPGSKVAIIASGTGIVYEAVKASKKIEESTGIKQTVVNMHTIKPIDKEKIKSLLSYHDLIVTVEEHNILGGLGSAVAEYLTTLGASTKQIFIGIEDKNYIMGDRPFMLDQAGLTADKIAQKVIPYL
jgi:transketolase